MIRGSILTEDNGFFFLWKMTKNTAWCHCLRVKQVFLWQKMNSRWVSTILRVGQRFSRLRYVVLEKNADVKQPEEQTHNDLNCKLRNLTINGNDVRLYLGDVCKWVKQCRWREKCNTLHFAVVKTTLVSWLLEFCVKKKFWIGLSGVFSNWHTNQNRHLNADHNYVVKFILFFLSLSPHPHPTPQSRSPFF